MINNFNASNKLIVKLTNGRYVTIRPILASDAEIEKQFIDSLSPESKYRRFFNSVVHLTPEQIKLFTNPDCQKEFALIATTFEGEKEIEIGVGRFCQHPKNKTCEVALVVADDWHHYGLGHTLLNLLKQEARKRGITTMLAEILINNSEMIELSENNGFHLERQPNENQTVIAKCNL